ncbi:ABC transporter substrate-binding protein [Streptomyces sp. NPDC001056]
MPSTSGPASSGRRTLLKTVLAGASVLSASALLEACGAQPSGKASAGAAATAGADTGKQIALLRVALPGSLSNLYPGQESGILNYIVAGICMEGLFGVDPSGQLVPGLATKVRKAGAKRYVYTIRSNARFQDGSPVTVADILYSIERARDTAASPSTAAYWADLDTAEQTGDHEITLTSKSGDESFVWLPSNADALWILPKSTWQKAEGRIGTASALPLGSGPYKVTDFAPDSHVELERVDTWWGTAPKAARIRFDFIPDDNTRLLAWKAGKADLALNVPPAAFRQWESAPRTRVVYSPDRSYVGLTFNTSVKPFDDAHVRKAIAHAVDRQAIVRDILRGHGAVATALSTPEQFGGLWSSAEATRRLAAVPQYDYSLDEARRELAESSVPKGFTTSISYPDTGPQLGTAALALAADLKKIGITLHVEELPIEQWLSRLGTHPGLGYMWYFNTTGDPGELASWLLGADNPARYANRRVTTLLTEAGTESDPAKRAELLIQAQSAQAADVAYAPLWWGRSAVALTDAVGLKDYTSYTLLGEWPSRVYAAK